MAFVEKRMVPVQFGGGINTKVDPKQLQAGQLLALQNGQFSKEGQINKRFGYDILGNNIEGGGTITAGVELANYKNELVLFDGTSVYSLIPATGNWANRGTAISIITEDKNIIRTSQAQQLNPDMAYANGIELYAWEDSRGGVRYSVFDTVNKTAVVTDAAAGIAGAQQPKCITFNGLLYLFYIQATNLYYQTIGPLNPSVIQPAVLLASNGFPGINWFPYDVASFTSQANQPRLGVAFICTSPKNPLHYGVQVMNIDPLGTVTTIAPGDVGVLTATHGTINAYVDTGGTLWVSWCDGVTVFTSVIIGFATSMQSILNGGVPYTIDTANAVVIAAVTDYTTGQLRLFYEVTAASTVNEQTRYTTLTQTGTVGPITTMRSVGLASKPWTFGGKIFVNTAYSSTLQATDFTWYVPQTGSPAIVSKMTPGIGGGLQTLGMCPEIVNISYGLYKFANLMAGKLISEANTLFSLLGVNSTKIVHSPTDNFLNAVQANTLLIVGGVLQGYDGVSVTELGFHLYPEGVTYTAQGSGGNLSAGTYQYITQWEWTDNNGQIYRSAPSVAKSVTAVANDSVLISGPSLRLTNKTKVSIVIYRTLVNGTLFRRVTSTLAPTLNDPTTDTWTFTDTLSDVSCAANELNYTTGGILNNIAPPANSLITTFNNRTVLAGMSDKLLLWYSQTTVTNAGANTVPPQFCQELTIACDPRGGDITALGLLNQTLILFKAGEIFALNGNGPDATGNNNDFGDPTLISSEVGCTNPNSVVVTSLGLFFQSSRGIYLLDQALNLTYIGAPVEAFNNQVITAAVENGQDSQIVFVTASGTALIYDHYFRQWSTWTNHFANDVTLYQNKVCFVTPAGQVWLQNRSKFTDGPSPILMSWTLPNLSFAGIQGYQRVFRCWILGTYKGPHNLNVSVAYDFADSYTQTATIKPSPVETWGSDIAWGAGQGWGLKDYWGGAGTLYEFRVDFKTQKCTSIRLQVADSQSSNYNEGYAISNVAFEVGVLPGGQRLPASSTYGAQ